MTELTAFLVALTMSFTQLPEDQVIRMHDCEMVETLEQFGMPREQTFIEVDNFGLNSEEIDFEPCNTDEDGNPIDPGGW